MWKRFGGAGYLLFILLFWAITVGAALGACGDEPQPPPEGFSWPVRGEITQPWSLDCRTDKGHRGIDISAGAGTIVRASASGFVSFVGYTPAEGGGTTITIDHAGGLRTTYLHLSEAAVKKGQELTLGDPVGLTDERPLHFGIKRVGGGKETYYNPEDLLPPPAASDSETRPEQPEPGTETGNVADAGPATAGPTDQAEPEPVASVASIEALAPVQPKSVLPAEMPTVLPASNKALKDDLMPAGLISSNAEAEKSPSQNVASRALSKPPSGKEIANVRQSRAGAGSTHQKTHIRVANATFTVLLLFSVFALGRWLSSLANRDKEAVLSF